MSDPTYRELLIGCGNNRQKRIRHGDVPQEWQNLVTLDMDEGCKPDVVMNLDLVSLPWQDNHFDEIHAYEVLEHTGTQGDWRFFFRQFEEFWRVLKPGGLMCLTVPAWDSPWAYADPGHKRVMPKECFYLLYQKLYEDEIGKTSLTDYRAEWKGNFQPLAVNETEHQLGVVLKAIKD